MEAGKKTLGYIKKSLNKRIELAKKIYLAEQIEYLSIIDECNGAFEQIDMYGIEENSTGAFGI